jgi:hypothetical protein
VSLTSVSEVQARVVTDASAPTIQALIDEIEAEITAAIGAPYSTASTTIQETVEGEGAELFLRRPILTVDAVTNYSTLAATTGTALTEGTDFFAWPAQGRLTRLPTGAAWGERVVVDYVPQDDRKKWKGAIIDLARLRLSMTPMRQESISGEFGYTAPENWEAELRKVMRRLSFREI